jgi:hypothetical protein
MVARAVVLGLVMSALASPAQAEFVAERIDAGNAATRLFGGTDADGGIGDWYVSNGVIEAIIDDVGPQDDLPPGTPAVPKQSGPAGSGGSIIDLGLVGADNDQLSLMFSIGGLSAANFVVYDGIAASTTAAAATITVTGTVRGFEPLSPSDLVVVTEYTAAGSDPFLTIRTSARNNGPVPAASLGGFLDVFPWTTRALVPFSPLPARGFRHGALDVNNLAASVEVPIFSAAPGTAGPGDGVMDPETGALAGEVSYGLLGVATSLDADGPGGAPPVTAPVNQIFGTSGVQATALGNLPVGTPLDPGESVTYERRLYVGARNDVASVANLMFPEIGNRLGFGTGTLSGAVGARDAPGVAASVIVTRTGGVPIAGLPNGSPVTQFRTDASGVFEGIVVPEGTYGVEARSSERDPAVVTGIAVAAGENTEVTVPLLSGLGTLALEVRERTVGPNQLVPAKVTIKGRDGTPDPQLGKDLIALEFRTGQADVDLEAQTFAGSLAQGRWVYLENGAGSVQLRPGAYEVYASRGLEYSAQRRIVRIREGETRRRRFRVRRIVETPGALSADFHIHSARSLDTSAGPLGRVVSFAAEGVEVMVSSDHDFVLDYGPVIAQLGLHGVITSVVGTEVTTTQPVPPAFPETVGHINGWPLAVDPHARRDGSPEDEFVAPNFIFSRLRRAGAEVIQYNHPRAGVRGLGSIGFFNNIGCNRCENDIDRICAVDADCPAAPAPQVCTCVGYRPERPITAPPNDVLLDDDVTGSSGVSNPDGWRNIDFDALEVGNGLNSVGFLQIRADWFSLLNQVNTVTASGTVPFIPGTGVSDSHRNTLESAGYFRTYVLGTGDDPVAMSAAALNAGIKAGRMVATTGPYIEFAVRDAAGTVAGVGDTIVPATADVTLAIRVRATNWIPVEEVRVIANGNVVSGLVFDDGSTPAVSAPPRNPWSARPRPVERFAHEATLTLTQDTWLLVEAGSSLVAIDGPDPVADIIVPGFIPLAFTNPVFVDLEGDGFDPPGGGAGAATTAFTAAAARTRAWARDHHAHVPLSRLSFPESAVSEARRLLGP